MQDPFLVSVLQNTLDPSEEAYYPHYCANISEEAAQ